MYNRQDELLPLVQEKGVCFRCTAAVGGGIGWLSELERARRVQSIRAVSYTHRGIVTCDDAMDVMQDAATEDMEIMAAMTPSETVSYTNLIPDFTLSTPLARSVLPEQVNRRDAIYNTSHEIGRANV